MFKRFLKFIEFERTKTQFGSLRREQKFVDMCLQGGAHKIPFRLPHYAGQFSANWTYKIIRFLYALDCCGTSKNFPNLHSKAERHSHILIWTSHFHVKHHYHGNRAIQLVISVATLKILGEPWTDLMNLLLIRPKLGFCCSQTYIKKDVWIYEHMICDIYEIQSDMKQARKRHRRIVRLIHSNLACGFQEERYGIEEDGAMF